MKKIELNKDSEVFIVMGALRYYMGRMTISVSSFTEWLVWNWPKFSDNLKFLIQRDLEEEFVRDDKDRQEQEGKANPLGFALGWDCDRKSWEQVRKLWK